MNKKWLTEHLKANDWWIRKEHAKKICSKLAIHCDELEYYRDIYIWLPDVRWGEIALPVCPKC